KMALRFSSIIRYAIPGALALLGCWWIYYHHRKKHVGCHDEQAIATTEKQQEQVLESHLLPEPRRPTLSSQEEFLENEPSTSLLSAGSMTPPLLCEAPERLDLSWGVADLSVTMIQPSTFEDDSGKLETVESQDESSVLSCLSPPLVPKSTECHGSAAVSRTRDSGSSANQGQWPPTSATLTEKSWGLTETSSAEQSGDSSFKNSKESQMPGTGLSDTDFVTALCLGSEKEDNTPEAFLCNEAEVVSNHMDSAVSMLPDGLESACLEKSKEEKMSASVASPVPVCREEVTQPKGGELEREKIRGVSLDKEETEKIEQAAMQIVPKVILEATEEVLSGSASDVSAQTCQAATSRAESPLEMASVVSSDQMLMEGATVVVKSDAAVLTSPQTEEQDRSVTGSSCLTRGRLSSPASGDTKDCRVKSHVCSVSQGAAQTSVENHGASLEKSPSVMEDSGCRRKASEGGTSVADPLQNAVLPVTSGQLSDSLRVSATPDASAEQSSASRGKGPAQKLPSNGVPKDGPELHRSDGGSVDFMDSGCAMKKMVSHRNATAGGESSDSDFLIWEIEVPKDLIGRLIGKQGKYMGFLRQASGAKIYVATLPYLYDSRVCHIEGTRHQVEKVLSLIGQKFKDLCLTNVYGLPPPTQMTLHSLLLTAWLFLPDGVTVEVVVANQVNAGHMFLQQHTHPTFHVLRTLDQQMYACYSQPEIPTLPTPSFFSVLLCSAVGIICAAPGPGGAWSRAQVISYFQETGEVELLYVDYGGYEKVKIDTLRQIRSDFLSLPFQVAEVLLDNVAPLPDEDNFSSEADAVVSEMTRGAVLIAQV
ncbi:AKAP1 protein, partial [Podargus strigoides]|nr:AKAP1 protein [Podargus strigoides]